LTDLRVRFTLSGQGEVWVDDLRVLDLDFNDRERLELSKVITLADYKRKRGRSGRLPAAAGRLLAPFLLATCR